MPGSYSVDSWNQYLQMVSGNYNDWFGPALPATWRFLWLASGSFMSLYVLQMALYWVFITLLLWRQHIISLQYWVVMGMAVFFCFIPQYIMRDSLMSLTWGIACLLLLRVKPGDKYNIPLLAATFALFYYGLWVRPNALPALVPLLWACLANTRLRGKVRLLAAVAAPFVLFVGIQAFNYKVLKTTKEYPAYKLKLLDIAGISKLSGENYFPACITSYPAFSYDTVMKNYHPATFDNIYWPDGGGKPMVPYPDATLNSSVDASWKKAVAKHPLLYLKNRGEGFLYYLHIFKRFKDDEYWNVAIWIDPGNPLHMQLPDNKVRDAFGRTYNRMNPTCLYAPWFWLLLNAVAFAWAAWQWNKTRAPFWQVLACIQLSGLLYILSQLPVYQHDRDFRYTYWNVFVALIAIGVFSGKGFMKPGNNPVAGSPDGQ